MPRDRESREQGRQGRREEGETLLCTEETQWMHAPCLLHADAVDSLEVALAAQAHQLHLEVQRGPARDGSSCAAGAIPIITLNDKNGLLAHLHASKAQIPEAPKRWKRLGGGEERWVREEK